jgi:hypothetical protein
MCALPSEFLAPLAGQVVVVLKLIEQPVHLRPDVLRIAEHAASLADAYSTEPTRPSIHILEQRAGFGSFHSRQTGRPTSMARKPKPLVLNDVIVELDAPGLQIVKRPNGELWQYWVVSHEGRRRGYLPRTIRLHYDLTTATGRLELEHRCKILTNEMLVWLGDPEGEKKPLYDGTVAALIRCYQTDKNSPYKGLRQNTARVYADWCRTLERAIGKRRVDHLSGQDIRDCFLSLMEPASPGGAPRVRLAKSCTRSMLSILLNYGAELGLPGCLDLAQVLERMTLRVPQLVRRAWKAARPKKTGMTYDQAAAIVTEGLQRGTRRHRSVALGVAAQFELTLRQSDVIGEWEKVDGTLSLEAGAIVDRGRVRRPGLRFEQFAAGELDLETSKTDFEAVFDVTVYPLFQQALASVPPSERDGPLVTDDNGLPVRRRYYWDLIAM